MPGHERKATGTNIKHHFEPDLDFQFQAIEAFCDLFRGQEVCRTEFMVTAIQLCEIPLRK